MTHFGNCSVCLPSSITACLKCPDDCSTFEAILVAALLVFSKFLSICCVRIEVAAPVNPPPDNENMAPLISMISSSSPSSAIFSLSLAYPLPLTRSVLSAASSASGIPSLTSSSSAWSRGSASNKSSTSMNGSPIFLPGFFRLRSC